MRNRLVILITLLMLVFVTACSGNDSNSNEGGHDTVNEEVKGQEAENKEKPVKSEEPQKKITVTALKLFAGEIPSQDGPGLQMINDRFNVDYQLSFVPQANYDERISALLASGSIPDIIRYGQNELTSRYQTFAKQGAFLALDEYIDEYPSLSYVPNFVWEQLKVDGKVYAIPQYFPKFTLLPMIRQDWLDNLNLKTPTSLEELKDVAMAFTKEDPDQNGKDDTYGMVLGKDLSPAYNFGAYWDAAAYYHKNEDGQFIPGMIGEGRKQVIELLADLHREGAVTPDFVTYDANMQNKEFYSGKAGIYIGSPRGMNQSLTEGLLQIHPGAEYTFMAPPQAPDGSQGLASSRGFVAFYTISAEAGKDPEKVRRILEMLEIGRTLFTEDQMNPENEDFDWLNGGEGQGYDYTDGTVVMKENWLAKGLTPKTYLMDLSPYPQKESDRVYKYTNPVLNDVVQRMIQHHGESKFYGSPHWAVSSPTDTSKGAELNTFLINEQAKMVVGQRPVSEWEQLVDEWSSKGGAQIIEEYNAGFTLKDPAEGWE